MLSLNHSNQICETILNEVRPYIGYNPIPLGNPTEVERFVGIGGFFSQNGYASGGRPDKLDDELERITWLKLQLVNRNWKDMTQYTQDCSVQLKSVSPQFEKPNVYKPK